MFSYELSQILYIVFVVALLIGAVVLIVIIGRLMLAATSALQSYRRVQELKIELAIADGADDITL